MKHISPILASAAFVMFSGAATAATDTKTIDIEVTKALYAELTGSAVDGTINTITMDAISANTLTGLGSLGVSSNGSSCSLAFSTLNDYALLHEETSAELKKFNLDYLGTTITSNADANGSVILDSCVTDATALTFTTVGTDPAFIQAGAYNDVVSITLTAE